MSKMIDMTGRQCGYWYVLERAENNPRGQAMWRCKCLKCNETIAIVSGVHLRSGASKACTKCRQKKMAEATIKNEAGKTYGFLYVERKATEEEKPRIDRTGVYWNCTCLKCGRKNVIVFGDYLRNGDTKSCGCLNSINESKICKYLDSVENLSYTQQKRIPKNIEMLNLMYDFYIKYLDKEYIIEYDGIQHFENGHFHNNLSETRNRDRIKNKYCFENNIPIIRIPYDKDWVYEDLFLETTRFLLTPENEKEYYEQRNDVNEI